MTDINERKLNIRDRLLEYSQNELEEKEKKEFAANKEANELLFNNPTAYLFGVIFDQQVKAERAWEAPLKLKKRLGHLDIEEISSMPKEELVKIFREKPNLHRYPEKTAGWIKEASQKILREYNGKTETIWKNVSNTRDIYRRLKAFKGIGQKKASMATNILVRRMEIDVDNREGIDVSYDIHVRRVFLRTGLVDKDDKKEIIDTARKLNPEFPAALDTPAWKIGRKYCSPKNPKCSNCPIEEECAQKTDKNIETV